MLDTIKLHSPHISEKVAEMVAGSLNTRLGIDNLRDVLMYEIVGGDVQLEGSFDHRVRVAILRKKAVWVDGRGTRRGETIMVDCEPYLEVEGSVHKAMIGHNVYGGPMNIRGALWWLVRDLERRLDAPLPFVDEWRVRRLDWAVVFDLEDGGAVGDYLWAMGQASYPRRRAQNYGRLGCFFAGDTTALKFYHKGPEFRRHDYGRVKRSEMGGHEVAKEIAAIADSRMRVEVSIKAPVLDKAYAKSPTVGVVSPIWCADRWENEVQKVVREGRSDMDVVRTTADVRVRLRALHGTRGGNTLFATWVSLSTLGEDVTKGQMLKTTFYRHRSELVKAGCAWRSTDLQLVDAAPRFGSFVPTLVSPLRDARLHPRVEALSALAA